MDGRLAGIAATQGGVFLRRQALASGYSPAEVKHLLRREWSRVRHGAYVESDRLVGASDVELHHMRIHAVLAAAEVPTIVSGVSAAVVHGLEVWQPALGRVQLTHPGRTARVEPDVHHHDAEVPADERATVDGMTVTSAARAVVDIARVSDFEQGLVVADSALRSMLTTATELRRVFDRSAQWPGAVGVSRVIADADGRAQNLAESRTRAALITANLPPATPQVYIYDENLKLIGIVDLALLGFGTLVEFDGKAKYALDGDPQTAIFREKVRGDRLGDLGYQLARPVWADLMRLGSVANRVRAALARAANAPTPLGYYRLSAVSEQGPVPTGPYLRPELLSQSGDDPSRVAAIRGAFR